MQLVLKPRDQQQVAQQVQAQQVQPQQKAPQLPPPQHPQQQQAQQQQDFQRHHYKLGRQRAAEAVSSMLVVGEGASLQLRAFLQTIHELVGMTELGESVFGQPGPNKGPQAEGANGMHTPRSSSYPAPGAANGGPAGGPGPLPYAAMHHPGPHMALQGPPRSGSGVQHLEGLRAPPAEPQQHAPGPPPEGEDVKPTMMSLQGMLGMQGMMPPGGSSHGNMAARAVAAAAAAAIKNDSTAQGGPAANGMPMRMPQGRQQAPHDQQHAGNGGAVQRSPVPHQDSGRQANGQGTPHSGSEQQPDGAPEGMHKPGAHQPYSPGYGGPAANGRCPPMPAGPEGMAAMGRRQAPGWPAEGPPEGYRDGPGSYPGGGGPGPGPGPVLDLTGREVRQVKVSARAGFTGCMLHEARIAQPADHAGPSAWRTVHCLHPAQAP
jgi:hypothetical protein